MPRSPINFQQGEGVICPNLAGALGQKRLNKPQVRMMTGSEISAALNYEYKFVDVLNSQMAYLEAGQGDPIVLLHGNPTCAYIWRNVIPHLDGLGRCLAPDLIGMGNSGKVPSNEYRYPQVIDYLDAWFEAVAPEGKVTLVVQDWGAALGFNWANNNRDRIRGIAYMEAMVQPRRWSDLPENYQENFKKFRTDGGLNTALDANIFIEKILPFGVARGLSEAEMAIYRKPYLDRENRLPTIAWNIEIPFDGEPADNHEIVQSYADWLSKSDNIPKLFLNTSGGHALIGRNREFCRSWPNQIEVTLSGKHYIQEDDPHGLGQAVAHWMKGI